MGSGASAEQHLLDKGQDVTAEELEAFHANLQGMKVSALKKEAISCGVDEGDLNEALDSDDIRATMIRLILDRHRVSVTGQDSAIGDDPKLLAQLNGMNRKALEQRARQMECDEGQIEEANDADAPKPELIKLILAKAKAQVSEINARASSSTLSIAMDTTSDDPAQWSEEQREAKHEALRQSLLPQGGKVKLVQLPRALLDWSDKNAPQLFRLPDDLIQVINKQKIGLPSTVVEQRYYVAKSYVMAAASCLGEADADAEFGKTAFKEIFKMVFKHALGLLPGASSEDAKASRDVLVASMSTDAVAIFPSYAAAIASESAQQVSADASAEAQENLDKAVKEGNIAELEKQLTSAGRAGLKVAELQIAEDALKRLKQALRNLDKAVKEGNLVELEKQLASAERAGLMGRDMKEAAVVLKRLRQAQTDLVRAVKDGNIAELEKQLSSAAEAGLKGAEIQKAEDALKRLKQAQTDLVRAVKEGDIVELEKELSSAEEAGLKGAEMQKAEDALKELK